MTTTWPELTQMQAPTDLIIIIIRSFANIIVSINIITILEREPSIKWQSIAGGGGGGGRLLQDRRRQRAHVCLSLREESLSCNRAQCVRPLPLLEAGFARMCARREL